MYYYFIHVFSNGAIVYIVDFMNEQLIEQARKWLTKRALANPELFAVPHIVRTALIESHAQFADSVRNNEWVPIRSVEDLPKEDGIYVFTFAYEDGSLEIRERWVDNFFRENFRPLYVAWRPVLSPFQPEAEKEKV